MGDVEERGSNGEEGSVCHVYYCQLWGPSESPPPQRPELGGAGWAHSAGSTVRSSDCRPTGSLATERKADEDFTTPELPKVRRAACTPGNKPHA